MDFEFDESQGVYRSGSQNARAWTESWVEQSLYCPSCGRAGISRLPNNLPVADFHCPGCTEIFELKSRKRRFGKRILDGAYRTMMARLVESTHPNLFLLNYNFVQRLVTDVAVVPKQFFVQGLITKRNPLGPHARRAGWVGCTIWLERIPAIGRIPIVRGGEPLPRDAVLARWQRTLFLREEADNARGWLIETIRCIEKIGRPRFSLEDMYAFEAHLGRLYPNNRHVKQKLRQQLQILRDRGFLEFLGRGQYRVTGVGE